MLFPDPNGRADVFGGFDGHFYQLTMWQWAGSDWTQLFPSTVPFARADAAVGANTLTGQVVMFGGLADVNPNNTWTYDGTNWTPQVSGSTQALHAVWGISGSPVFAVGDASTILRYDGTSWTSLTTFADMNLRGIWGTSPTNVFAVGAPR